jgi:hypothetical protein
MHSNGQLFEIERDRGEDENVAGEYPEVAERLSQAIEDWRREDRIGEERPKRPFTIGHPEATWTQLPARDATFTGNIERSNRFPNCTYLLNWTDPDDEIRWDVEVLGEGDYRVQMYYVCPAGDVGSTVELSLGSESISAKIDQAAESPLIGAQDDRVERQEGYVRRWQPITLGTLRLTPGRKVLRLRASQVAGSQVAEMRLLMLKKLP